MLSSLLIGTWRRLVAHLNGVQGAAGSNPVVPTRKIKGVFRRGGVPPLCPDFQQIQPQTAAPYSKKLSPGGGFFHRAGGGVRKRHARPRWKTFSRRHLSPGGRPGVPLDPGKSNPTGGPVGRGSGTTGLGSEREITGKLSPPENRRCRYTNHR
jgi:hypothetical protein